MSDVRREVEAAVAAALAEALPELGPLDPDAALTGDLGLDSVQIMNLVMEIEDNLDLSVPVDILAEVRTLNQLTAQLVHLKEKQA
ncbi:MAG: acyl carrier protein [Wenzhouxiangella sp.]|nr:MAG: acyl carrier protein [Wenzhouxiangella sp.]